MSHLVLLGDSIFDNDRYVPGGPSVIEHLHRILPRDWRATLLARDGAISLEVAGQLERLPPDATHLFVSAGGNDALESPLILNEAPSSFAEVLSCLAEIHDKFQKNYQAMLKKVLGYGKPIVVCTVYDSIPVLAPAEKAGLCLFNDVILREAFRVGVPVIDLRLVCNQASDYSSSSPIEPSVSGGGKIARAISQMVRGFDFTSERSRRLSEKELLT